MNSQTRKSSREGSMLPAARKVLVYSAVSAITLIAFFLFVLFLILFWAATATYNAQRINVFLDPSRDVFNDPLPLLFLAILRDHFQVVVGLPLAAIFSVFIVALFETKSGPIEMEVAGFKLKGASGPVMLWAISFLALTFAIHMLW